jgi:hypothetical protein
MDCIRLSDMKSFLLSEDKVDPRINPNYNKDDNEDIELGIDPDTMLGRWTIEFGGKPTPQMKNVKQKKEK